MVRRKKRSILQAEHGPEFNAVDLPSVELLAAMASEDGRGVCNDPGEMIWTGGGNPINIQQLLRDDLEEFGALDRILLAIIGSNCDFSFPPERGSAEAADVRHRLEEAKKYLLGRKSKQGPPSKIDRRLLREIANRYWLSYAGARDDLSLRAIAADVVAPARPETVLDHKQVDDLVRPYIDAFKKDKDRLLLQESSVGLPEIKKRQAAVATIIDRLTILELVRPDIQER